LLEVGGAKHERKSLPDEAMHDKGCLAHLFKLFFVPKLLPGRGTIEAVQRCLCTRKAV
jgi:hypothetical protein